MERIYQQGDVILKRRSRLPKEIKALKPKTRGWVLAEGEQTGHAHTMTVPGVQMYEDAEGTVWVKVDADTDLRHGGIDPKDLDHHTQVIAKGVYELGIVQEVDPFSEEVRNVQD